MKLQTKIPVTHVDLAQVAVGGTREGALIMEIGQILYVETPDGNKIVEAHYKYIDDNGNVLPTAKNGVLLLKGDIDTMSAGLGNTASSFSEHFRKDVKSYAMNDMATLFGIQLSDIEEVLPSNE